MSPILIRRVYPEDRHEWLRMRMLLWPNHNDAEMLAEMDEFLSAPDATPVFIAQRENGKLGGFLEGGTRKYADGCDTSPVGYIEGWYVDEDLRLIGIGRLLVNAMEDWVRHQGLTEIGSDTWLENQPSITAHQRLGFSIKERLAHFAKKLD